MLEFKEALLMFVLGGVVGLSIGLLFWRSNYVAQRNKLMERMIKSRDD